jgi:hypothetical protein
MSIGCGTLASPGSFGTGITAASRSNGKQHTLPISPTHSTIKSQDVLEHWGPNQPKSTTRLWGSTVKTKWSGEERPDQSPDNWLQGEYWNVDSNIKKWNTHEVKRNAASANHDVHRHDQIKRIVLSPHPHADAKSQRIPPRQCISGAVSPDCCFLETWGFDLGMRDRQGVPIHTKVWRPTGGSNNPEQFRSLRSYNRNTERMTEYSRSMRRYSSVPSLTTEKSTDTPTSKPTTMRPEDIGGDVGEMSVMEDKMLQSAGRIHGTRSCRGWDDHRHTVRREAAKMSHSLHSPAVRAHKEEYPYVDGRLAPAGIYRRTYRQAENSESAA